MSYEPRYYRKRGDKSKKLKSFTVSLFESDLLIYAQRDLSKETKVILKKYRRIIENYIKKYPEFLHSLNPLPIPTEPCAEIIGNMIAQSVKVNVGPMAAVAGAIAQYVGKELLQYSTEIIIENGGDIFLKTEDFKIIGLYSGERSLFDQTIGIGIAPENTPMGICTSSGMIGHSLSLGRADAVVVMAKSAVFADAAATRVANLVKGMGDVKKVIEVSRGIKDILGLIIIVDDQLACYGDVQLVNLDRENK